MWLAPGDAKEFPMATTEQTKTGKSAAELKQKLQQRIDEAKQQLDNVKKDIAQLREEDKEAIRAKAAEIRQRIDAQQDKTKELREKASSWAREKSEQTTDAIQSWRQKRAVKKLQDRADRAEEYAVNALVYTMMYADEAEVAMIDAVEARLDADEAVIEGKA
jgi:chromosome segregation ATPase